MLSFLAGAIYFGYKAHYLGEKWGGYALAGALATGIINLILGFLVGLLFSGIGGGDDVALFMAFGLVAVSLMIVDRWSGLYWDKDQYLVSKEMEEDKITPEELAKIRSLQIQKGDGVLDEVQEIKTFAAEESLVDENSEELELTQNGLPGEIDYITIPDSIQKILPKDEEGLLKCISEYEKYTEEEWTENIPMYAAIELDKMGFVYTSEIRRRLDNYAQRLKFKNFVEIVTEYIPK